MKKVFTGAMFTTLSLLLIGTLSAGAACTPSALPGDTDQDGSVSCSEAKQQAADRFVKMDTNKDKQLTMAEFQAGTTKNFEAMDKDKNGMVDMQEYLIAWCGPAPKVAKTSKKAAHGIKQSMFKSMDANKDGKVTSDECVAFWTIRFADIDGNKDGKISKEEFNKNVMKWFSIVDANKDGSVTATEFTSRWVGPCQAEKSK
ncbi:MAG: EF-hand domain-containing protein [Geobacteraceae bacterium]